MCTKILLIIFAVLLLLLTLLSAFGGTLTPTEHFYQDYPFHELFHEGTFIKPSKNSQKPDMFGGCSSSDIACMKAQATLGHVEDMFKTPTSTPLLPSSSTYQTTEPFSQYATAPASVNPMSSNNTSSISEADTIVQYHLVEPFTVVADYSLI